MKPLIIYQKLTEDKIETFIQMRINQFLEEEATGDIDLAPALRDYFVKNKNFMQCSLCGKDV